ncbi:MAG: hypothetical protein ACJ8C4_21000 [Gemmataceae bacterium]
MQRFKKPAGAIVLALVLAVAAAGCMSQKYKAKVVGTWDWSVGGGTVLVTINQDGTGSLKGPVQLRTFKWRIQRGNNFVFNDGLKDSGFLIDSADDNMITGTDPETPGQKIIWRRKT